MKKTQTLIVECKRIADEIINLASFEDGLSWHTMHLVGSKIMRGRSQNLYLGASGITLFLLEASRVLNEKGLSNKIVLALESLGRLEHLSAISSFLTGNVGIPYPFIRAPASSTNKDAFEEIVERVIQHTISYDNNLNEFINGRCGTIIGLLRLTQILGHEKIFPYVDELLGRVIDQVRISSRGIVFDRDKNSIQPLCGFAHGAAGMGFVFAEVYRYFNNPSYAWFAKRVFQQEKTWYDNNSNTWLDLRKSILSEQDGDNHKRAFESGNHLFFLLPSAMTAWCHGAPGIGMSRLRAWQLFGDVEYFQDFERAVQKVRKTDLIYNPNHTFTLCHGSGGNADLLIEGYRITGRSVYRLLNKQVSEGVQR